MPLTSPNLDDRQFAQLVAEAKARIPELCPDWTDRSPSDPGIVLLELFAYLTETLIYRLNRLPQKAYVEFLRLMGVSLRPPSAAAVTLVFSKAVGGSVEIPRGCRVTTQRASGDAVAPVFVTARAVPLAAGAAEVEVLAYHCDEIEAELAGLATGVPGSSVTAKRPPIIAPSGDELDILVGIEAKPEELDGIGRTIVHDSKTYRIWREVQHFSDLGTDRRAFTLDRSSGLVQFPPSGLGETPTAGLEIRLWYRRGGGAEGNVPADSLAVLREPFTGVRVTNPRPAAGGRSAESVESALARGPQELHSLERAVTARDYELVALNQGGVSRSKAATKAALWRHATPGTVQVVLVPAVAETAGPVTPARMTEAQSSEVLDRTKQALEERRPLGTLTEVSWVRTKTVRVRARVVAFKGEDKDALRARLKQRLSEVIAPTPVGRSSGWSFGDPLRIAHVYVILQSHPGVQYVDDVALIVDEVPKETSSVAADPFERNTWYAGSGAVVFRSLNHGEGWESAGTFQGERIKLVRPHPERAGLLAVLTEVEGGSRAHISWDCGEHWELLAQMAFTADDLAWTTRDEVPVLLLATDVGLYELVSRPGSVPNQILVDPKDQGLGFYAVAVSVGALGGVSVALAARGRGGIYLSTDRGRPETFRNVGLQDEDVRVLAVQTDGPNSFLWAGLTAPNEVGRGCFRARLWESAAETLEWREYSKGWDGGTCRGLAFHGSWVFAGTHFAGVAKLDSNEADPAWAASDVASKLPILQISNFVDIPAIAVDPSGAWRMVATQEGVFRAKAGEDVYQACSKPEFIDRVTLPPGWLFCSGEHEIEVIHERIS